MSLESAFLEMMPSTVTLYPPTGVDAYGKPSFSATGTQVRCRIMDTLKVERQLEHIHLMPSGTVIFYGSPTIDVNYRMVLPNGEEPEITSIRYHLDDEGSHHITVTYT